MFNISFRPIAKEQLIELCESPSKKIISKAVLKAIRFMGDNIKHPSLNTHKYDEFTGPDGQEIFLSYAQNNTPGAYRIFWFYGPGKKEITIIAITPHP